MKRKQRNNLENIDSMYDNSLDDDDYYNIYNMNNIEKYPIYKSIIRDMNIKIIGKQEEILSIEKSLKKQSLYNGTNILEYKFLVIGDTLSGKSSFCLKFAKNKFNLEIKKSTDMNCYIKTLVLFNQDIKIYLIDVIDSIILNRNINNNLYSNIKGIFALYDVTKNKSLKNTLFLVEKVRERVGSVVPVLLVGNKTDLKNLKCVNINDAMNKSAYLKCDCKETNCIEENEVLRTVKYFVASIYYNDLDDLEKEQIRRNIVDKENKRKKKNQNL